MGGRPLDTILELHDALTRLEEAEALLAGIPEGMREIDAEYQQRKKEIDELEEVAETAGSERRAAQGDLSEAEEKLKKYQGQLNEVSNQREYGALLQEIDTAKTRIEEAEEATREAQERIEEANEALESKRAEFEDLETRYREGMEQWEKEKPGVAKEAETLSGEIETLREAIDRRHLSLFERIRKRIDSPAMAPIHEAERKRGPNLYHCGVCNYHVRPQAVVEIRSRGTLVSCDNCKRILYVEPEETEAEEDAEAS